MEFALNSEQTMLRESARGLLGRAPDSLWTHFAEMGWLAMALPDRLGGLGSPPWDIALLCEELGRARVTDPFIECGVIGLSMLSAAEVDNAPSVVEAVLRGKVRVCPALFEPGRRYALEPQTGALGGQRTGYRISGKKVLVAGGQDCDCLILTARLEDQIGLFLVDTKAPGVSVDSYETLDNRRFADFSLSDVALGADAFLGIWTEQKLERVLDEARLYLCADMIGGLDRTIELTAAYLKTRFQFGQSLSDFQGLQHSVANMFVDVEGARSALLRALSRLSSDPGYARAVSGCFVKTFGMAKRIAGMGVHLHGAIGFTAEYEAGHYLQRAIVNERLLGDVEFHLQRYMDLTPEALAAGENGFALFEERQDGLSMVR